MKSTKPKFIYTRAQVNEAVLGVLEAGARVYTVFSRRAGKQVGKVTATRAKSRDTDVRLTIGRLNYAERAFVKKNPNARVRVVMA